MSLSEQEKIQPARPSGIQPAQPADSRHPLDPTTRQPLPQTAQPGYYPGFSTLSQQNYWDEPTRRVILDRVNHPPPIRFFTPDELPLITAILDRVLPQDDRDPAHRVPIVNHLDHRLHNNIINGYRYEGMPPDPEVYRLGLQAIEAMAQQLHGQSFAWLGPRQQDEILKSLHDGQPGAAHELWQQLDVIRFWQMLVQDAIEGYYSHPYAWDEIGFGGPAYPRGYMRQENGQPEPWEVPERRYEWDTPPDALSGDYTPLGGNQDNQSHYGQEGTH